MLQDGDDEEENELENWGDEVIRAYSLSQSRGLWSYEIDETAPLEPQAKLLSCATRETGPIAIYQIKGHEVVVLDSWFRRQRFRPNLMKTRTACAGNRRAHDRGDVNPSR